MLTLRIVCEIHLMNSGSKIITPLIAEAVIS